MWQQWWQRVPETARVMALLALVVDVVGLPSVLVMLLDHTLQVSTPWAAWIQLLTHAQGRQTYALAALALLGGAVYWAYSIAPGAGSGGGAPFTAFGSARWRTSRELAGSLQIWRDHARQNPAGLVAGAVREKGPVHQAWILGQDGHNLLLGAPGAGKSLKVMMPSIAVIAQGGENLVVTDPKGELKEAMAPLLQNQGYRIATLDLRFPARSVRWNPLQPIQQALQAGAWADATRMANDLATLVAAQGAPGGDNGAFWAQSARAIGAALALLVADQAPSAQSHLASAYAVLTQQAGQLDTIMQALPLHHPARQAYGPLLTGSAETRQNQLSVVAVSLSLFADPNIAWLTAQSDWQPDQLLSPRTAVFIVVPDDSATYYPLAALFVQQLLQTLAAAAATRPRGRLAVPVHFLLDEFGNLPKIPDFDKALAVARGRGIRITLALQSLSQLDDRYGQKTAETMRNSCNTWVYLSANDNDTARIVSDKIGQTTIETTSQGQNWQTGSRQWSQNTSQTGRALVTLDEVLRWRPDHTLLLQMGQLPAKLPARLWFDWPQGARLGQDSVPVAAPAPVTAPSLWTAPAPADAAAPDHAEGDNNAQAPVDPQAWQNWRPMT